jgi:5-methylthioribose kinase
VRIIRKRMRSQEYLSKILYLIQCNIYLISYEFQTGKKPQRDITIDNLKDIEHIDNIESLFPQHSENIFHKESYDELFDEREKYVDSNYWRPTKCSNEDILMDL